MRLVHIYWSLGLGGIETMLVNIVNEQVELLDEVYVVIINDKVESELLSKINPKVKVKLLRRKESSFALLAVLKLNYFLATHGFDLIHSHYSSIIKMIIPRFRKNACVTLHAMPYEKNTSGIKKYKKVFAISESVRNSLYNYNGVKSTLVYNGINLSFFKKRDSYANTKKILRIVTIGRLIERKGQDLLVKAIGLLSEKDRKRIQVDFIGDGPSYEFLIKLINELKLSNVVRILGEKKQEFIASNLCNYDLFVCPSRREGFGLTVIEAMAAKVPVLVSDEFQGPIEIIGYGKYGFTFKNGDIEDCAMQISNIINDPYFDRNVDSVFQYANDHFNVKGTALNYVCEYKRLL